MVMCVAPKRKSHHNRICVPLYVKQFQPSVPFAKHAHKSLSHFSYTLNRTQTHITKVHTPSACVQKNTPTTNLQVWKRILRCEQTERKKIKKRNQGNLYTRQHQRWPRVTNFFPFILVVTVWNTFTHYTTLLIAPSPRVFFSVRLSHITCRHRFINVYGTA